jgi:hypothetical protein
MYPAVHGVHEEMAQQLGAQAGVSGQPPTLVRHRKYQMHQVLTYLGLKNGDTLREVEEVYARIEENYKLGNSFQ